VVKATTARELVIAGALSAVLTLLLVQLNYETLPELPTLAGITLLVLAIIEGLLAVALRPRLQRKKGARPVQSVTAVRVVALAKASSLLGAIMLGVWIGLLAYVLPRQSQFIAAANDTITAVIGAISAALLIAAALWLEHCCRSPDDPTELRDDDEGPE
jgi:hypothetical protein